MTHIDGVQPAFATNPAESPSAITPQVRPVSPPGISDVVEISEVAKLAAKIQEIPEVRTELVERVKAEIAAGTYETPQRIEAAVDRLIEELGMNS